MTTFDVVIDRAGESVLVGQAYFTRERGQISTTFIYDPPYLADGGTSIDPALPLVSGAQHQVGLVRAFADSAPDRWGRNLVEKAERARARQEQRAPRRLDDLDFLLGVSDDTRQGALRYRVAGSEEFVGAPSRVRGWSPSRSCCMPATSSPRTMTPAQPSSTCSTRARPAWAVRDPKRLFVSTMARWPSPSSRTPATGGTSWRGSPPRWI